MRGAAAAVDSLTGSSCLHQVLHPQAEALVRMRSNLRWFGFPAGWLQLLGFACSTHFGMALELSHMGCLC